MRRIALAVIIILTVVSAVVVSSCSKSADPITVAYAPFESTALFWVAEDQSFFSQNGLSINTRKYDAGAAALDGMVNGDADIAIGASEFPMVGRAFQKETIKVIGNIDKAEFIYLIGRKDRGIEQVSDLKGKKIGTTFGTVAQFHLGRYLNLHGLGVEDITSVNVKAPAEWVDAIVRGDIDAIATAQPYAHSVIESLGDNAVVFPAQSGQPVNGLVISSDEWTTNHPELVSKFLKSLEQAEEYVIDHPSESKAIVQKRLNLDAAYVERFWSQNQFSLSLEQGLILTMEDEARWMIANNLTDETTVPDFLSYIYVDGLEAVKPGAVSIIR